MSTIWPAALAAKSAAYIELASGLVLFIVSSGVEYVQPELLMVTWSADATMAALGTPAWMAPEQTSADAPIGPQADGRSVEYRQWRQKIAGPRAPCR